MIEFEYRENGQPKKFNLEIDFISRGVRRMIEKSMGEAISFKKQWEKIGDNYSVIAALREEKPDGYKEKIKHLELENKAISGQFKDADVNQMEEDRIKMIQRILRDNGIQEDHKMFDPKFWEDNVQTNTIVNFLTNCWGKDIAEAQHMQKKNLEQKLA